MADYPMPKFHFQVQWGGTKIGFTEVTGLEVTTEKIEYRDGATKEYHKTRMPGMQTFGDLTLKRGVFAGDNEFDITISLLNESHDPVVVWKVKKAWPTKVTSTDLNASGNETAIETLVLTHEGLTMENG
jgi:phage tail-like protein